eukprot:GGOE01034366.1.p2 GENE.GGOE01034366.1~~GGOE01034366.1.p2  ORF type:complete len:133 (+),score=9.76 GGOE01034366.1:129-527(+)
MLHWSMKPMVWRLEDEEPHRVGESGGKWGLWIPPTWSEQNGDVLFGQLLGHGGDAVHGRREDALGERQGRRKAGRGNPRRVEREGMARGSVAALARHLADGDVFGFCLHHPLGRLPGKELCNSLPTFNPEGR